MVLLLDKDANVSSSDNLHYQSPQSLCILASLAVGRVTKTNLISVEVHKPYEIDSTPALYLG